MEDLYKAGEYCMAFSNEELEKYLLNEIRDSLLIEPKCNYFNVGKFPCDVVGNIKSISLDIDKDDFIIRFFRNSLTAFFILDEIFMFYDYTDKANIYEIPGGIVYEGNLRQKTHEQILKIFLELSQILYGAEKIEYKEYLNSKTDCYKKNNYIVKLIKSNCNKQVIQFENILFLVN